MRTVRKIARIALFVLLGIFILYLVVADSSRIGLLLILSGVMGVVVGAILVIELIGRYAVYFGKVTCSELKVVNPDGTRTAAVIYADDQGGCVRVYDSDGNGEITMKFRDRSGLGFKDNSDGGINVVSKDGKSSAEMSIKGFSVQNRSATARMSGSSVSVHAYNNRASMYADSDGAGFSAQYRDGREWRSRRYV